MIATEADENGRGHALASAPICRNVNLCKSSYRHYAMLVLVVSPSQIARVVTRDIDGDAVIACALATQKDWIVAGDTHLLGLKIYQGTRIIDAAIAVRALA